MLRNPEEPKKIFKKNKAGGLTFLDYKLTTKYCNPKGVILA
jgi:hypothetical protein